MLGPRLDAALADGGIRPYRWSFNIVTYLREYTTVKVPKSLSIGVFIDKGSLLDCKQSINKRKVSLKLNDGLSLNFFGSNFLEVKRHL